MQSAIKAHKRLLRVSLIEYIRNMQQSSLYNYRAIYLLCLYQVVNQSVNEELYALEVSLIIGFKQYSIEINTVSIISNNSEHIYNYTWTHSIIDCT